MAPLRRHSSSWHVGSEASIWPIDGDDLYVYQSINPHWHWLWVIHVFANIDSTTDMYMIQHSLYNVYIFVMYIYIYINTLQIHVDMICDVLALYSVCHAMAVWDFVRICNVTNPRSCRTVKSESRPQAQVTMTPSRSCTWQAAETCARIAGLEGRAVRVRREACWRCLVENGGIASMVGQCLSSLLYSDDRSWDLFWIDVICNWNVDRVQHWVFDRNSWKLRGYLYAFVIPSVPTAQVEHPKFEWGAVTWTI